MTMRMTALALVAGASSAMIASRSSAAALLVPAYFNPADHAAEWSQLTAAATRVGVTAIFNPNSGPGTAVDAGYLSTLATFRAAGGKAIGYVHTQVAGGGLRSLATVEAEVDTYRSLYGTVLDGIFVDEMTSNTRTANLNFYNSLYTYIKAKNTTYTVVGNPGTNVPVNYATTADVLVTEEDSQSAFPSYVPTAWTQSRPASGFANILHDAPANTLTATLAQAIRQNVSYLYVTDDGADGNPYDSLPTYFTTEVNAVAALPEPTTLAAIGVLAVTTQRRRSTKTKEHP